MKKNRLVYRFGPFRLDPDSRRLELHTKKISLTPKVFDTLLLLVENAGRLLKKEEMMKAIWPETCVEEGNLSQNVYILRKIFHNNEKGKHFIETRPKTGYRFVMRVKVASMSVDETSDRPEINQEPEMPTDSPVRKANEGGQKIDSSFETEWLQRAFPDMTNLDVANLRIGVFLEWATVLDILAGPASTAMTRLRTAVAGRLQTDFDSIQLDHALKAAAIAHKSHMEN